MNNKSRFTVILILALLLVSVLPAVSAQDDAFKVAVVAPSATNDLAFSQSMYDALVAIQTDMGEDNFTFDFKDGTFLVDDAAADLREWASSGDYDLIIAHGSQYGAIIEELAPEFPETSFAWGTDVNTFGLDNVFAYTAAAEEGGFVNGALAAELSMAKNIGIVGPIEVGDAKAYIDGFKAGVAYVDPSIEPSVNYIGSFDNVSQATQAAQAMIDDGADVLTGSAQMVVGPIGLATEDGLLWFGTQSSQAELAGDAGVLFQVYKWDVILTDMIEAIKGGTLGGEAYTLTLENGGLAMEPGQYVENMSGDDMTTFQDKIDGYIALVTSGEVTILPEMTEEPTAEATP